MEGELSHLTSSQKKNLQLSSRFLKMSEGHTRHLLVYEAKIMDVLDYHLKEMLNTTWQMLQFMRDKAETTEDRLKIADLHLTITSDYFKLAGELASLVDGQQELIMNSQEYITEIKENKEKLAMITKIKDDLFCIPTRKDIITGDSRYNTKI